MLDQGIIQKSNSPWGSPLQLVVKKNGKIRPCCDYRFLKRPYSAGLISYSENTRLSGCQIHEENNEDQTKNKDGGEPIQICAVKTRKQTSDDNIWTTWNSGHSKEELLKLQEDDPDIGPLLQWKESDTRPNSKEVEKYSAATRHYWHLWESVVKKDGLLFKQYSRRDGSGDYRQFLVPDKMKKEVLNNMHNSILSGHLGKNKTKEKLAQRYYWYEMKEDIQIWISQCDICGANKPPQKLLKGSVGKNAITDYFTKWVEVFPVPDQTATTCANIILNDVICRFGFPLAIHSDQGRNYESDIFQELCSILDIRKTRTSPRNPKCNGQVERFNRTLVSMIKSYLRGEQTNWDLNLGCLASAYRACPHDTTSLTPNVMMLGREIRFPYELTREGTEFVSETEQGTWGNHALKVRERLQKAIMND
ncbi:Hypothetical predicted protein [Mytilus galloprovincialis]|uniref:Integrase catalytic domain-containing protein n=1 Tax=Mytilus galloprovincialis TaxID=29158 RepID=A0A8B6BM34_MYTGA|nr:Hypothetical predicted protein [Mytilus galloprovincialis]